MSSEQDSFTEKYQPVLFNIEVALTSVYKNDEEMTDWEAERAVTGLIRRYQAEQRGSRPRQPLLNELAQQAFDAVEYVCEWQMGRVDELPEARIIAGSDELIQISIEEVIACLKRTRKSIQLWHKEYGRRGYFDYVNQFLP